MFVIHALRFTTEVEKAMEPPPLSESNTVPVCWPGLPERVVKRSRFGARSRMGATEFTTSVTGMLVTGRLGLLGTDTRIRAE